MGKARVTSKLGRGRVGCFSKPKFGRFPEKNYKKSAIYGRPCKLTMSEIYKRQAVPYSDNLDEIEDYLSRPNQMSARCKASLLACAARIRSQRDSDKSDIQEKLSPKVVTTTKSNDSPDSVLLSSLDQVQKCYSSSTTKPKALIKKKKKNKKVVMV